MYVYSITMLKTQRKFAPPGLSHSAAHHLLATGELIEKQGYARVSDIARSLSITRGSVSVAMQSLRVAGYVRQGENHFFSLTDEGTCAIDSIRARHEIVERFLSEVLALPLEDSHRESCRLEYLIEGPTARRLSALLQFWRDNHMEGSLDGLIEHECPECNHAVSGLCPSCGLACLDNFPAPAETDQ